jgi:hypothetical protein
MESKYGMATQNLQSPDPEIEALLAKLSPERQEVYRDLIERTRQNMSEEVWAGIRIAFLGDLRSEVEKKRLEEEMSNLERQLDRLQELTRKYKELKDELDSIKTQK